ncbi:MAG: hypothetical protein KAT68_07020 [Bacteroidales bacterium]|nr:hypothetical protein [Bacteroidales bacterium]
MNRHHVIISGTGRTETSFIILLLTKLGIDTGFDSLWKDGFRTDCCM